MRLNLQPGSFAELCVEICGYSFLEESSGRIVPVLDVPPIRQAYDQLKSKRDNFCEVSLAGTGYRQVFPRFGYSRREDEWAWTRFSACSRRGELGRPRLSIVDGKPVLDSASALWRSCGRDEADLVDLFKGGQSVSRILIDAGIVSETFDSPDQAQRIGAADLVKAWRRELGEDMGFVCSAIESWPSSERGRREDQLVSGMKRPPLRWLSNSVFGTGGEKMLAIRFELRDIGRRPSAATIDIEADVDAVLAAAARGDRVPYSVIGHSLWTDWHSDMWISTFDAAAAWFRWFAADGYIPFVVRELRKRLEEAA